MSPQNDYNVKDKCDVLNRYFYTDNSQKSQHRGHKNHQFPVTDAVCIHCKYNKTECN